MAGALADADGAAAGDRPGTPGCDPCRDPALLHPLALAASTAAESMITTLRYISIRPAPAGSRPTFAQSKPVPRTDLIEVHLALSSASEIWSCRHAKDGEGKLGADHSGQAEEDASYLDLKDPAAGPPGARRRCNRGCRGRYPRGGRSRTPSRAGAGGTGRIPGRVETSSGAAAGAHGQARGSRRRGWGARHRPTRENEESPCRRLVVAAEVVPKGLGFVPCMFRVGQ